MALNPRNPPAASLLKRVGVRPATQGASAFSHLPPQVHIPQRDFVAHMFVSERYRRLSAILTRKYDLTPDSDLGWLVGVILGDGYIWRMQSGGYVIGLDTPEVYYANLFGTTLAKRFPGLWAKRYFRRRNRLLNGKEFVEEIYTVRAVSKFLYDFLRPHKQRDFHWTIPSSIRKSRACTRGFLQGIYDAEGGVQPTRKRICLTSKHRRNLSPVRELLQEFGIEKSPLSRSQLYSSHHFAKESHGSLR